MCKSGFKIIKRLAAVTTTAALAIGVVCINASAFSASISLHQTVGAPSSANQTSQSWSFTTASSKTAMKITMIGFSDSNTDVFLYSSTGISAITKTTVDLEATNVTIGIDAYASASLNGFNGGGTHYAYGTITG